MMSDNIFSNQSIIISLDVDSLLPERLRHVIDAGFSIVEINSCDEKLLRKIIHEFPNIKIGAGNIVSTQQLENAYLAGVHFASSPGFLPAIAQTAAIYSVNYLPGIATPSEAMQVIALGYQQARPYPASLAFCTLINKSLPSLRLFPAEIEWDETEHYLSLPAVAGVSLLNPESKILTLLSDSAFA